MSITLLALANVSFLTSGELRYIGSLPPELSLDAEGTQLGQGAVLDQRLRAGFELKSTEGPKWSLGTSWDLFTGQLVGDTWDAPGTIDERHREDLGVLDRGSFLPRKAGGSIEIGPIGISAGLTTSHWGLGMIANDGAHDPEFGRSDFGDRVLRLRLGTRPFQNGAFPLTVALAGDRVVQDDLASMAAGQVAWQGVAAVLYQPKQGTLGLYGVYRDQTEPILAGEFEPRTTRIGVIDLFGEVRAPVGKSEFRAGAEIAEAGGRTTRSQSYESPDGLAVLSGGATGYLGIGRPRWEKGRDFCGAKVRAGWASGDANPDDGTAADFTFDRDYDAGMLLFDEQMGGIEVANYALITDPTYTGHAPDGAEVTVTEGSFRRAAFVQPVVEVNPLPWVGLRAGVMAAWSTAPIAQSFYTFRNGGTPTNHLNQPTAGRALGTEIDWAIRLGGVPVGSETVAASPELLLQGAHLLGSKDMGAERATMLTGTVRARW